MMQSIVSIIYITMKIISLMHLVFLKLLRIISLFMIEVRHIPHYCEINVSITEKNPCFAFLIVTALLLLWRVHLTYPVDCAKCSRSTHQYYISFIENGLNSGGLDSCLMHRRLFFTII